MLNIHEDLRWILFNLFKCLFVFVFEWNGMRSYIIQGEGAVQSVVTAFPLKSCQRTRWTVQGILVQRMNDTVVPHHQNSLTS